MFVDQISCFCGSISCICLVILKFSIAQLRNFRGVDLFFLPGKHPIFPVARMPIDSIDSAQVRKRICQDRQRFLQGMRVRRWGKFPNKPRAFRMLSWDIAKEHGNGRLRISIFGRGFCLKRFLSEVAWDVWPIFHQFFIERGASRALFCFWSVLVTCRKIPSIFL